MSRQPGPGGRRYAYGLVGHKFLLAKELGVARAWLLLWRLGIDLFGSEGKDPGEGRSPRTGWGAGAWRFARTARNLVRYLFDTWGVVHLPVPGEVATSRDAGVYKVADLRRGVLYTVMTEPFDPVAFGRRVALSRRAEENGFAPAILDADVQAGWFAEQFVSGRHPIGFGGCSDRFEELYLPLLAEFLRAEPVATTTLHAYTDSLLEKIFEPGGLLRKLPMDRRIVVMRIVRRLEDQIRAEPDRPAPLTMAHGDFFSGNLVIADDGKHWAIDWANLGTRSALHDLYFLVHSHCVRVLDHAALRSTLVARVATLRARLEAVDPIRFDDLKTGLSTDDVWRWVFYLECIQTPLERCSSPDERYVDTMMQRIGWFEEFEDAVEERFNLRHVEMSPARDAQPVSGRSRA